MKDVDQGFVSDDSFEGFLNEGNDNEGDFSVFEVQVPEALQPLPSERKRYPILRPEEVDALIVRIRAGDEAALDKVVRHNLGLVTREVWRYMGRGLTRDDLIQEGRIGLMIAARKHDLAKGAKFSTYAMYWIRQRMARAVIEQGNTIRVPCDVAHLVYKVLRLQEDALSHGLLLTRQMICQETGLSEKAVQKVLRILVGKEVSSLDQIRGDSTSDGQALSAVVSDPQSVEPCTIVEAREELRRISQRVEALIRFIRTKMRKGHHDQVFISFYGLDANRERRTLRAVGEMFSLTGPSIRQALEDVWKRVPKDIFVKAEFEQALAGIPLLEEIAQGEFSWHDSSLELVSA